jgi:hypothetical protein
MSSDKPKPIYRTELDLAEDEFFAQFEEKDEKLSVIEREKLQVSRGDLKCTVEKETIS